MYRIKSDGIYFHTQVNALSNKKVSKKVKKVEAFEEWPISLIELKKKLKNVKLRISELYRLKRSQMFRKY